MLNDVTGQFTNTAKNGRLSVPWSVGLTETAETGIGITSNIGTDRSKVTNKIFLFIGIH
jgi:hypothetical protein